MNNSVASSTSDVISFRVREGNERNREGGSGRQARLGIIRCSRRTKPLVAASSIARNRRLTFAIHHHYAILEAILTSAVTFEIYDGEPNWDGTLRDGYAHPENALFTNALSGIILEVELRAPISRSLFSPNASRKLRIGDDARRKEPSWRRRKCKVHSSRIGFDAVG